MKNLLKGNRHLKCRQPLAQEPLAQEPRAQEPLAQEPTAEQQPPAKSNSRAHVFVRHRARPQKCSHFTTAYRKLFFIQSTTHIPSKHMHKRIQPPSPHANAHSNASICLSTSIVILRVLTMFWNLCINRDVTHTHTIDLRWPIIIFCSPCSEFSLKENSFLD